jgi:cyanophycinase
VSRTLFPILVGGVLSVGAALSTPAVAAEPEGIRGSLMIVGGALRYSNTEVWSRIVELAAARGEKNPRIAVIPTASGNPTRSGSRVVDTLNRAGAKAFLVPVGFSKEMDIEVEVAVRDPQWVQEVSGAGGVFFTGGEQRRLVSALYAPDGKNTPLLDAIWAVYKAGGVIAGTSAGAAVMSQVMCRDADRVIQTLINGVNMGKEIDRGFGFLDGSWFVDQHALARGRFARALVIMRSQGVKYGLGVDENTAVEVHQGEKAKVVGQSGALVLDLSEATHDPKVDAFNLRNAKLSYLENGDEFDLKRLKLTPSPQKQAGQVLSLSPDAKPRDQRTLFSADILGNTTVADLMTKLVVSKKPEALGLAFDGAVAREQPSPGFEFRFYRSDDTIGWTTSEFGGETYTVANVRLDVRPVQVTGPLYK